MKRLIFDCLLLVAVVVLWSWWQQAENARIVAEQRHADDCTAGDVASSAFRKVKGWFD